MPIQRFKGGRTKGVSSCHLPIYHERHLWLLEEMGGIAQAENGSLEGCSAEIEH